MYWQEAHDLLKRWSTALWQAASRLHRHPRSIGISLLAQEQAALGWGRPDWWVQVVGLGRALLFAQLVSLGRKGTMPVLVERNAFWVISDEAHPPSAVPGLLTAQPWRGIPRGTGPLLLTTEVRDAFKRAQHAGELALALDTLAGESLP